MNQIKNKKLASILLVLTLFSFSFISSYNNFAYNSLTEKISIEDYLNKTELSSVYVPYQNATFDLNLGDKNINASTGYFNNISADSISYINPVAQYHREEGINTLNINAWENITFDTKVSSEITKGYILTDNNQSVQVNFSGIVKLQGKVTVINNATASEVQKIALRIISNGTENRCTQVSSTTQRGTGNYNTIAIQGTTRVVSGDIINLQYQVDDTDLDIWGDDVFDTPVAVSLNFEKISN